jgi:hypothetical protein
MPTKHSDTKNEKTHQIASVGFFTISPKVAFRTKLTSLCRFGEASQKQGTIDLPPDRYPEK